VRPVGRVARLGRLGQMGCVGCAGWLNRRLDALEDLYGGIDVAQRAEHDGLIPWPDQIGMRTGQPWPRRRASVAEHQAIAERSVVQPGDEAPPVGIRRDSPGVVGVQDVESGTRLLQIGSRGDVHRSETIDSGQVFPQAAGRDPLVAADGVLHPLLDRVP